MELTNSQREARDAEFIKTPAKWPLGFRLPLKKVGGDIFAPDGLGFIIDGEPTIVRVGDIYGLVRGGDIRYDSIEALVKEWMVD